MSADLVRFVEARIAEDEAAAQFAVNMIHSQATRTRWAWLRTSTWPNENESTTEWQGSPDPARVLRQCEASRRIVAHWPDPFGEWTAAQADAARAAKEYALRALASIWRDHPEFREEWSA